MFASSRDSLHCRPDYQAAFRALGIDADAIFNHRTIKAWRDLPDRQNCTLDLPPELGGRRLHVKRYFGRRRRTRADAAKSEIHGLELLEAHGIATTPLVAWGHLRDGRSFVITEDLVGYAPADRLLERGLQFDRLLELTAALAARLHDAGLHHRDLYLCHFFARPRDGKDRHSGRQTVLDVERDLRIIDAARVRALPRLRSRRWIIKDLAQFWYSTQSLPVSDEQRRRWLATYAQRRGITDSRLRGPVIRKAAWIAAHDAVLRRRQPKRNISIPDEATRPRVGGSPC
jgi:hypothetical protein